MLIGGSGSVGWGENVEGEGGEDGGGRRWGGWWWEKVGRMVEGITISDTLVVCLVTTKPKGGK